MKSKTSWILACAAGLMAVPMAVAQADATGPTKTDNQARAGASDFDPALKPIADMLTGSWTATGTDPATGEEATYWLHVSPIHVEGTGPALYVEQSRDGHMGRPFRQTVFTLYTYVDTPRLRTWEFHNPDEGKFLTGSWSLDEPMLSIQADMLYARMDIELPESAKGYAGSSPNPYPTDLQGAVQMMSSLAVHQDEMATKDEGWASDGSMAWSQELVWKRSDPGVNATKHDNGLVTIDLEQGEGEELTEENVGYIHYTLWLTDGRKVDSSLDRGQMMKVQKPWGFIQGFGDGLRGMTPGMTRIMVIPPELGYGDKDLGVMPPNSTLVFAVELHEVEDAPAEGEDQPQNTDAGR